MGTDIHIRYQRKQGDEWATIDGLSSRWRRSYFLFGVLAGVRDTEPHPIAPTRGWPAGFAWGGGDVDSDDHDYGSDFHSRSWLLGSEIVEHRVGKVERYSDAPEDGDALIAPFVDFVRGLMAEHGEVRLVFAFTC